MKKTLTICLTLVLGLSFATLWQSCKKEDNKSSTTTSSNYVLSIQTGARTTNPDQPVNYTAVLVDNNGNVTTPSNVEWSVSGSGGATIGAFSGSGASATFTPSGSGYGTIQAKVTVNGTAITAKAPIGVFATGLFAVAPSAVIWTTGAGTIPLNPVYIGTGTPSYQYESTDGSVASVSSTGEITFNKAGECAIKVTANGLTGSPSVYVPVLVVGTPSVPLPVVRVQVTPISNEMFRGESKTLSAKAFNSGGAEVTSAFTWATSDASVASVDGSGRITALSLGKSVITATASGITGQAEIEVLPDTAVILTPYWASIAAGGSMTFTAKTYKVNRSDNSLSEIANPSLNWSIPTYGLPIFDIATVNSTGTVSMRSSATVGMSTFVLAEAASPTIQPGVAAIWVSECDCGTTTSGVANITVTSPTTVNLSVTSSPTATITAQAVDATGSPVSGATLRYCTSNMAVCNVDTDGTIIASGPGTATVTICNGSVSRTITVNVTL